MRCLITAALLLVAAGCTPESHRIPAPYPYKGAEYSATEIEAIAADNCRSETSSDLPPNGFSTDGCSMWPDGDYRECCIEHDMQYWCGGPTQRRGPADEQLRECVAARSNKIHAFVVYTGTRLGGGRLMPFSWRWGYGYPYPYSPTDDPEATED
jgi:hypothetical protein